MIMGKSKWTDKMLETLAELFPVESTAYTADILGMSETSVKNKARELGISKCIKNEWHKRAAHIRDHFHEKSFSEMAEELGICKSTVFRIAASLGLKRTTKDNSRVHSRVRSQMVRREKRRIIFGLEPITRIKVVTNRAKVRLRSILKHKGYVVGEEQNLMFYPVDGTRRDRLEARGAELGLKFRPAPAAGNGLLTTVI